jgi:hypothetical protein
MVRSGEKTWYIIAVENMGKGYEPGNEKFEDFGRNSYG